MKKEIASVWKAYREYRRRISKNKTYRIFRYSVVALAVGYFLLLSFPQVLFAHSTSYRGYTVYSTSPLGPEIEKVLDGAEARLARSTINDPGVSRRFYLTGSHGMYTLLSNKAFRSFANSLPLIDNVIINRSDPAADLVFVNREVRNSRSLSGVVAHEVTHLLIRKKLGTLRASLSLPTWKNEGYCEYIAGDTTITFDEGLKLWRENPSDDTGYRYFKYHQMVKYLLDTKHLTIEQVFDTDYDEAALAAEVLASLTAPK